MKPNHVAMTRTVSVLFSPMQRTSGGQEMTPFYVALTALTGQTRSEELAAVASALQTQVTRDFAPEWGVNAVVAPVSFEAIPAGYIPLIVQDTLEAEGANGFHRTRGDDTPYIIVPFGPNWPLAASHELLRMLADPSGSGRRPGPSRIPGQATVEYLLDVCAPCQDISAAYAIDGVPVADFCTPAFFGAPGRRCSFTGAVRDPFEPGTDGVVTWLADDALLYQARTNHQGQLRVHGGFSPANRGRMLFRELVDMLTPGRLTQLSSAPPTAGFLESKQNAHRVGLTNLTRFRDDIAWRFGHASKEMADVSTHRDARRQNRYASAPAKSGQQRASDDVAMTVRTAS
jgi:hypothetical protein